MKVFVVTEIDPDYMDTHAYTNRSKADAKVKEFEEEGIEFEENQVDLSSNEYLVVYGEEGMFFTDSIAKQNVEAFLQKTENKWGAILDMKKGYARCYSGSALETENAIAGFEDGDITESVKSLKHIMLFEQFVNETSFKTSQLPDWLLLDDAIDFMEWYEDGMELKKGRIAPFNKADELTLLRIVKTWMQADDDLSKDDIAGKKSNKEQYKEKIEKFLVQKAKTTNESISEKVYQMTGSFGAKGIAGKVLFAFKKQIERIKYEGDEAATLEEINKVWSKWADKDGAKIIEQEVLKQIKDKESIVYIMATLGQTKWVADDVEGINAPGKPELLVRIPSDFVINIGFADDVDGSKFSRKLDGMMNDALMSGKETAVVGQYDAQVGQNNIEIRSSVFLTIDSK
jgi:hypothetical protein